MTYSPLGPGSDGTDQEPEVSFPASPLADFPSPDLAAGARKVIQINPRPIGQEAFTLPTTTQQGQTAEAIRQYEEAIRLKPDHAEAHNNLGVAFYQQGRTGEAIRQFQEALRLKPGLARARKNLEAALATRAHSSPPPGGAANP